MSKQAERILNKFGGAGRLSRALGLSRSTCFKWTYKKENGGTGGVIPYKYHDKIKKIAELNDIEILAEDWLT